MSATVATSTGRLTTPPDRTLPFFLPPGGGERWEGWITPLTAGLATRPGGPPTTPRTATPALLHRFFICAGSPSRDARGRAALAAPPIAGRALAALPVFIVNNIILYCLQVLVLAGEMSGCCSGKQL